MPNISIELHDRMVSVTADLVPLRLDGELRSPYRCVQVGINTAITSLASHYNVSARDILTNVSASIRVVGPRRELNVARLHFKLAFGLTASELAVLRFDEKDTGQSYYETFGFDGDQRTIRETALLIDEWQSTLSGDELQRWLPVATQLKRDLGVEHSTIAPAQIGIVGVAGAGKSSFINALLGRQILPVAAQISTATVIELRHPGPDRPEGLTVQWMPRPMLQARIEELRRDGSTLLTEQENNARKVRLRALESANNAAANSRTQWQLETLDYLAGASPENLAVGVEKIIAYIRHPLLELVTIVDTPGLKDPDPWRARIAIDAVSKLDAWAYLHLASTNLTSDRIDDWKSLSSQANNAASAVILTKIDDLKDAVHPVLAVRRRELQDHGIAGEFEACTAHGPSELLRKEDLQELIRRMRRSGYLSFASHAVDPAPPNGWEEVEDALRSLKDTTDEPALRDYLFDASGIPAAAGFLGRKLAVQGTMRRAEKVKARLALECRTTRLRLERAVNAANELRERRESADSLTEARQVAIARRDSERGALNTRSLQLHHASSFLSSVITERVKEIVTAAESLESEAINALRAEVGKSAAFELYGDRSFNLFPAFDKILASRAADEIRIYSMYCSSMLSSLTDDASELGEAIESELSRYTLHDKNVFVVYDREKFFELFQTMMDRMRAAARRHCRDVRDSMVARATERMQQILKRALSVATAAETRQQHALNDLDLQVRALSEALEQLNETAGASKDMYERQCAAAQAALSACNAFIERHSLESWQSRTT